MKLFLQIRSVERNLKFYCLLFGSLIFSSLFYLYHFEFLPFDTFDESLYLIQGMNQSYDLSWSLLYSKFYSIYFIFSQDLLFIYQLNSFLVSAIGVVAAAICLSWFCTKSYTVCLIVVSASILGSYNFSLVPKVQSFNFIFLAGIFWLALKKENLIYFFTAIFFWIISIYLRQDNVLIFPFFAFIAIRYHYLKNRKFWILSLCSLSITLLTWNIIGNPFHDLRTVTSFYDHFSWYGAAKSYGINHPTPKRLQAEIFQSPQTYQDLFRNNSQAMKLHLQNNFKRMFEINLFSLTFVKHRFAVLIFYLMVIVILNRSSYLTAVDLNKQKIFLAFVAACLFKSLVTSMILSPQPKYFLEFIYSWPIVLIAIVKMLPPAPIYMTQKIKAHFQKPIEFLTAGLTIFAMLAYEPKDQYIVSNRSVEEVVQLLRSNIQSVQNRQFFSFTLDPKFLNSEITGLTIVEFIKTAQSKSENVSFVEFLNSNRFNIYIFQKNYSYINRYHDLGINMQNLH